MDKDSFIPYQNLPLGTKFYFKKGYYKIVGLQHSPEYRNYCIKFLKGQDSLLSKVIAHQEFLYREDCYLESTQLHLF